LLGFPGLLLPIPLYHFSLKWFLCSSPPHFQTTSISFSFILGYLLCCTILLPPLPCPSLYLATLFRILPIRFTVIFSSCRSFPDFTKRFPSAIPFPNSPFHEGGLCVYFSPPLSYNDTMSCLPPILFASLLPSLFIDSYPLFFYYSISSVYFLIPPLYKSFRLEYFLHFRMNLTPLPCLVSNFYQGSIHLLAKVLFLTLSPPLIGFAGSIRISQPLPVFE